MLDYCRRRADEAVGRGYYGGGKAAALELSGVTEMERPSLVTEIVPLPNACGDGVTLRTFSGYWTAEAGWDSVSAWSADGCVSSQARYSEVNGITIQPTTSVNIMVEQDDKQLEASGEHEEVGVQDKVR